MSKDTLILAFLLTGFACLGIGCDEPADNPGEGARMPDRADAANPLLRHWFDTNTFPREMGAWKIPEGDDFKDQEIELDFSMGGGEVVNEVRVRVFIVPPGIPSNSAPDVRMRVRAPDGTTSHWEEVAFVTGNGGDGLVDHNAEVVFSNDFDGVISTGRWRVQLRDPVEDEDGRCLLRNATLRINGGLPAGSTTGSETAILPIAGGQYDRRMPEVVPPRSSGDFGYVGANKPVKLFYSFASLFNVRRIQFTFTIRVTPPATAADVRVCVTSPSGGWLLFELDDSGDSFTGITGDEWHTFTYDIDSAAPDLGNRFFFLGEPSAGTWTIYLWDGNKDGGGIYVAPEQVIGGVLTPNTPSSMTLS
jgi:hypothetical protein